MMDERVELLDDQGNPLYFQHLMTLVYQRRQYIVLQADAPEDDPEGEVVILEVVQQGEEEPCYVPVEDELLLEAVFAEYLALTEEGDEEA